MSRHAKYRELTCPRCGEPVRIPLFWIVGIEGIFRCGRCGLRFKTGYKTGALLSALGLSLSMASVQLLVYALSIYSMIFFVLLLIPLWIFYGFLLRRGYMLRKIARRLKKQREETPVCDRE